MMKNLFECSVPVENIGHVEVGNLVDPHAAAAFPSVDPDRIYSFLARPKVFVLNFLRLTATR